MNHKTSRERSKKLEIGSDSKSGRMKGRKSAGLLCKCGIGNNRKIYNLETNWRAPVFLASRCEMLTMLCPAHICIIDCRRADSGEDNMSVGCGLGNF